MKLLQTLTGGYKRVMDRLLTLQSESQTFINAQFGAIPFDMVLQGCAVVNNNNGTINIGAGIVLVQGNAIRFAGVNNVASDGSMAFGLAAPVTSTPDVFGDGSTKNLYSEVFASIIAQTESNTYEMKVTPTLYNITQYIQDQIYASETKGTIKEVYDLDGTFLANFNSDGLGVTPRWLNWQLDNGNAGTPGSAGMAIIGAGTYTDPVSGLQTTYANKATGGEINHTLVASEIPALLTDAKFGSTPGSAVPSIITINDAAGANGKIGVNSTGGGNSHNNMQPYRVAYRVVKIA